MASNQDLQEYCGESFEELVDTITSLKAALSELEDDCASRQEMILFLQDQVEHLTELAYP